MVSLATSISLQQQSAAKLSGSGQGQVVQNKHVPAIALQCKECRKLLQHCTQADPKVLALYPHRPAFCASQDIVLARLSMHKAAAAAAAAARLT
jgi:hypothetical protein